MLVKTRCHAFECLSSRHNSGPDPSLLLIQTVGSRVDSSNNWVFAIHKGDMD